MRGVSQWLLATCRSCALSVAIACPAAAQDVPAPNAAAEPRFVVPGAPESASAGRRDAVPTAAAARSTPQPRRRKGEAVVTYPGFRLLPDGRSRIFVELTKPVTVEEVRSANAVTYTLRGANVPVRNNRNALVTSHFATAVARARLVRTPSDVQLVIELRASVAPTHRITTTEQGGARLEVDFPGGSYPAVSEPRPGQAPTESGAVNTTTENTSPAAAPTSAPAPSD